ncbi:pentapeptide repeat protein Rfr32 [Lachnospiraceae bacterium]|jgi:energy-coupling factor transporter ATP-binding protein EcfA2|nr:pentapeptide repeat protein Rfr32 [Lachnospiraceae bacterium]
MMAELDILNGFAGKVISDCIDIAIDKIKRADKNRSSNNQTMETRIYQIMADALNEFPYNKYKKKEQVYDAAESILKELKRGNSTYNKAVRAGLKIIVSEVTNGICEDFLKVLCYEICKEENRDLAVGHIIFQGERVREQQQQMDRHLQEGFKENHQNQKEILEVARDIKCSLDGRNEEKSCKTVYDDLVVNRAEEYAQKWDRNVFLNDFNEEDENAGTEIKLSQIYIEKCLLHYIWRTNNHSRDTLRDLLTGYITNNNEKKMLLILGQPGIGKSTLVTWIMANLVENEEQMLVYQFASDLSKVNWQSDNILDNIFKIIGYSYRQLEGKTLILDGFDEIHINGDRERILHKLNQELKKKNILKKFSLLITCRENYISKAELERIEYITLQAWNEEQIISFCETYEKENTRNNLEAVNNNLEIKIGRILENKEIFGIPLILYMVLALNVDAEESSSKVNIYDQIFSLKGGGIYDRRYDIEHRINSPEIKKHIHKISQRIAFWMFENNADEATIPQEKFKEICDTVMNEAKEKNEDIQRDVLIGNYFASIKHCEGVETDELQFVHRSIYEYFVTVYFFESVHELKSTEKLAGKLGELLKYGRLSKQILEFIRYKFDSMKGYDLSNVTRETFNMMLRDGMTYYIGVSCKNAIDRERRIFSNMLDIVGLWNPSLGKVDNKIIIYLQCNRESGLNLSGADLSEANLREADLRGADLRRTNLRGAYLRGADLRGAYLIGADLSRADLSRADLIGTIFDESQINIIHKKYDLSGSMIYISETNETISYKEYCIRKQKK